MQLAKKRVMSRIHLWPY